MVVEDDDGIRTALRLALLDEGYDVVAVPSAEEALAVLRSTEVDLMLVDLMLGGMDGYTFIRTARASHDVPVIVLSARDDTHDIVAALEAGADDYVTKPFELKEVTARLRALRRRGPRVGAQSPDRPPEHQAGRVLDSGSRLVLDETAGRVTRGGDDVLLTVTEYRLLCGSRRRPAACSAAPRCCAASGTAGSSGTSASSTSTSAGCAPRSSGTRPGRPSSSPSAASATGSTPGDPAPP